MALHTPQITFTLPGTPKKTVSPQWHFTYHRESIIRKKHAKNSVTNSYHHHQGRLQRNHMAGNACVGSELSCNPGGRSACARLPQCREHTLLPQHPPPTMCVLGTITRAPAPTTHNVTVHAALAYAARTPKGAGDTRACPSTHRAQCEPHAIPHHPSLLI